MQGRSERHFLSKCNAFSRLNADARKEAVVKSGRCLNCLGLHLVRQCPRPNNCRKCSPDFDKKHYYLLHDAFILKPAAKNENSVVASRNLRIEKVKAAYNRVTAARIFNPATGKQKLVYCQHDPGSQLTFVSSTLVQDLGIVPFDRTSFKLDTLIGAKDSFADVITFALQSLDTNEMFCDITAVVHEPWSDDAEGLPHRQLLNELKHFEDVDVFAIDGCDVVDVIIGNDNAFLMTVIEEKRGESRDEPHAIYTPLGWLASGGRAVLSGSVANSKRVCSAVMENELPFSYSGELEKRDREILHLKDKLRELYLDAEVVEPSRNDVLARDIVEPRVKIDNGRFEIPVPLKANFVLPNNIELAAERLASLRKKALKQSDVCDFLVDSMCELKSNDYIEPVHDSDGTPGHVWYLPYFVTSQAKKRIVYDGKSKFHGVCVNDAILSGPDLLNSLVHILIRFRRGEFALMADITKCYFQINLPASQRDLFRILWFENNDVEHGKMQQFRFRVHPWGVTSSDFVACLAIQKMVELNAKKFSDSTCFNVLNNLYMDDLIYSADTLEEARKVAFESIDLFKSSGFNLVKWSSNKQTMSILSDMSTELLAPGVRELNLEVDDNVVLPSAKTLGCVWDTELDLLRIQCNLEPPAKYTRRNMLSQVGQNWDPLGFCGPHFLQARLILQKLAIEKFDWDDIVPDNVVKEWNKWLCSLETLKNFAIPRWYFAGLLRCRLDDDVSYELHAFSDASNQAFCSVVYLRRIVNGQLSLSFIIGKCTIVLSSQSSWTIARKELSAALNSAKLMKSVCDALSIPDCPRFFWCDSKTTLQWLKNPNLRLHRFVARRVSHILLLSNESEWHFCSSGMNAADVGTRPDLIRKAEARNLWLEGPSFLRESIDFENETDIVSMRRAACSVELDGLAQLIERASSLYELQKKVAYLMAFVEYFRCCRVKNCAFEKPTMNAEYLNKALNIIVRYVQKKVYGDAVEVLRIKSPDAIDDVIKRLDKSENDKWRVKEFRKLKKFRPCVDKFGLLRIEGRLEKSPELCFDSKHPLVLPSRHPLTRLVVLHHHRKDEHCGVQHTLLSTRKKFWIVNGNAAVKAYMRDCGVCNIRRAKKIETLMSDLPLSRTSAHKKPFADCGIDYFRPLMFKEGRSLKKAWGLLFTCMASRAIHVEMVVSLSLDEFLLAFTRFMDLRGPVSNLYSDNGSTFQAAAKKLPELVESPAFLNSLRQKGINWHFIPPYAPQQGGAWESFIKQFKIVLSSVLESSRHKPTFVELLTYTGSAVRIVNERPLVPLSDDPRDFAAITPAFLLTPFFDPYSTVGQPHDRDMLRRDYRFNVGLSQAFWEKWIFSYLPLLNVRKKWQKLSENLKFGQLVVLGAPIDITKRGSYQLGRVLEVIPQLRNGKPIVRRAKIAVARYDQDGRVKIEHVRRDISCLGLVENVGT